MSELGDTLAAERRRAGRSISEVEAATRVRGRLIQALEDGEWERLPSPAYVKGYIQSYARYLEIPVEPLLELYKQETGRPTAEHRVRLLEPRVPKREDLHIMPMRTAVAIAAVIAAVALAIWAIVALVTASSKPGPAPLPVSGDATTTADTGSVFATGAAAATGAAVLDSPGVTTSTLAETPVGAEFEVKVTIERGEASWIIVKVDGLKAYEGMMTDGDTKTWLVKSEASVGMGRPTATTVFKDGTLVTDKPQVIGKVPTIVLTAEP